MDSGHRKGSAAPTPTPTDAAADAGQTTAQGTAAATAQATAQSIAAATAEGTAAATVQGIAAATVQGIAAATAQGTAAATVPGTAAASAAGGTPTGPPTEPMSPPLPPPPALSARSRIQILDALEHRLHAVRSPIVTDRQALEQLRGQLESVLDEMSNSPAQPAPTELAEDIGADRASRNIHPAESLRAVAELFEAALPVLVAERVGASPAVNEVVDTAIDLNRTVMNLVTRAWVPYVDYLLGKVSTSHRDERVRLARELHDRAAHAVGVGLQSLELHRVYAAADPARADEKLDAAWQALHEAMQTIREFAAELRGSVGIGGLPQALLSYLEANAPPELEVGFSIDGDLSRLPAELSEEVYLVLREAVRNALLHGRARSLRVRLEADSGELRGEVTDDGVGFDPTTASGVGVASMSERVQLLGGTLVVTSAPGAGTGVRARLPLPRQVS